MQDAPKGETSKKMVAPHRERWEDRSLTESCLVHRLPGQGVAQLWEFHSSLRPSEAIREKGALGGPEPSTARANKCVVWKAEAMMAPRDPCARENGSKGMSRDPDTPAADAPSEVTRVDVRQSCLSSVGKQIVPAVAVWTCDASEREGGGEREREKESKREEECERKRDR